jgi:hypothetical protein
MAVFQASTNIHGKSNVTGTAEILQKNLTEYGLVRILAREDIAPELVRKFPVEEAVRAVQRSMRPPSTRPGSVKYAKKAKKSKSARRAKKSLYSKPPKAMKKKSAARPTKKLKSRAGVFPVQPNYWRRVKTELHTLICTDHPKYASVRQQLGKGKTQTAIVMTIGATIGATVGISATVIAPFVTLGLIALVRVGTNAWCAGQFD